MESERQMTPLQIAAMNLINRWETPLWKDAESTASFIAELKDRLESELSTEDSWRTLGLKFDRQRMAAVWHLKAMLDDPEKHRPLAEAFISEPLV